MAATVDLAHRNGLSISIESPSFAALCDWYFAHVDVDPQDQYKLAPVWRSIAFDVGIFLGEVAIARSPELSWELVVRPQAHISLHKAAIGGFENIPNKSHVVDFDLVLSGRGQQVRRGVTTMASSFFDDLLSELEDDA